MNNVLDKLQYTTIRIETRSDDGSYSDGTAFIYEYATAENTYPFLITAKHLISDAVEGRITLLQGKNRAPIKGKGYTLDIDSFSRLWYSHPDENYNIAITPFVPFIKHVENSGISIYFQSLNKNSLIDERKYNSLGICDEAIYVGYPENCWDRKTLLPIFRKGMLAVNCEQNYRGLKQCLLDSSVVLGSSGSPVFAKSESLKESLDGELIGVLTSLPQVIQEKGSDRAETLAYDVADETPMGVIIKIDVAIETIVAYLKEKGFI